MGRQSLIEAFSSPPPEQRGSKIDELEDRVRELQDLVGTSRAYTDGYAALGKMMPKTRVIISVLMKREECTKQDMYTALYGNQLDGGPSEKIIDVHVSHARKKLRPYGVEITTMWGRGWCLSAHQKEKIKNILRDHLETHEKHRGT